jgi:hypothetical protein
MDGELEINAEAGTERSRDWPTRQHVPNRRQEAKPNRHVASAILDRAITCTT